MGLLTVGLSHAGAPMALLERTALDAAAAEKLAIDAAAADFVDEAAVVSTCNRVEVYAAVDRFHSGVETLTALLARHTGVPAAELVPHLAVAYEDAAVRHLFAVTAGLASVVVGEPQIGGQVRAALRRGQDAETIGPVLNEVFQQALRTGRSVRARTGIDSAGPSLLAVALDLVGQLPAAPRVVILGAGSLGGLAAATVRRRGAGELVIVNRSPERAAATARLHDGRALALADTPGLVAALGTADLVIACTGAPQVLLPAEVVAQARNRPDVPAAPLTVLDLALPHDVDPSVAGLPGVRLIDLRAVADSGLGQRRDAEIDAARDQVAVAAAQFGTRAATRTALPAVVALRTMAAGVVDTELARLDGRAPGLSPRARQEVEQTVRRVVDKLLHHPSVRVRELAGGPGGVDYADALRELFALDPTTVAALTTAERSATADQLSTPDSPTGAGS